MKRLFEMLFQLYGLTRSTGGSENSWIRYSWNNISNNLFIEAPAGVGFSYCNTPAGCRHTDTSTANDNLAAVTSFLAAFPEYAGNRYWITGESYAGVYVPSLAYAIYNYNKGGPAVPVNLKGIMVGNGCIGSEAGHCGNDPTGLGDYHDVQQWRGHGLISETVYDQILKECVWDNESAKCSDLLNEAAGSIGDIDIYYLYNTCEDPAISRRRTPYNPKGMLARVEKARTARGAAPLKLDPNCYGSTPSLEAWGNLPATKAALHVARDIDWAVCSNNASFQYSPNIPDERTEIYPTLTKLAGYQVLVYNGEADLCVPFTDNEWWTRSMNYTVKKPWHAWSVPGEEGAYVGGYAIQYDNNFTFATVRGAGHMVPETRAEAALAMFSKFLEGKPL